MSRAMPSPVQLREMTPGQLGDVFVLLVERTRGATRDGKPFFTCRFRDAGRTATFMVWQDGGWFEPCDREWKQGGFYKVRGVYQEHSQYGPQIDIHNIRPVNDGDIADGFEPRSFIAASRFHPDEMYEELLAVVNEHIADEPFRHLVSSILEHYEPELKSLPATKRHFHPFQCGLLEHTLSVVKSCLHLVEKYSAYYADLEPPLNKDLVIAGAALHDIGRVLEFDDLTVTVETSVPGHLLGHLFLGRDIVRDAARDMEDVDPELVQLLEHLIVAHLNLPSWGSPRLPVIPEALILHHADDLDAKMEMYVRCLQDDEEEGPLTARDPVLNRQLLKGRKR